MGQEPLFELQDAEAAEAANPQRRRKLRIRRCTHNAAYIQLRLPLVFPPEETREPTTMSGFDRDAEYCLGVAVQYGRLAAEALHRRRAIPRRQRRALERIVADGRRAVTWLALGNRMLAYDWAYKLARHNMEDSIQAAMIGLIKAAERYDPRRARFSTYATFWIKQAIRRELPTAVSTPSYLNELDSRQIVAMLKTHPPHSRVARRLQSFLQARRAPLSLNAAISPDDDRTIGDIVPCDSLPVEEAVIRSAERAALRQALNALPEPHRTVLVQRFFESLPYEQIGRSLSMPRERVGEIEREALARLRQDCRLRAAIELADVA